MSAMLSGEMIVSVARLDLGREVWGADRLSIKDHVDNVNSFPVKLAGQ
jgi:hypothetical protein